MLICLRFFVYVFFVFCLNISIIRFSHFRFPDSRVWFSNMILYHTNLQILFLDFVRFVFIFLFRNVWNFFDIFCKWSFQKFDLFTIFCVFVLIFRLSDSHIFDSQILESQIFNQIIRFCLQIFKHFLSFFLSTSFQCLWRGLVQKFGFEYTF